MRKREREGEGDRTTRLSESNNSRQQTSELGTTEKIGEGNISMKKTFCCLIL